MENNRFSIFRSALLAGIAISMGCVVYLRVGGVAGAALFAFGLLTCVHFKLSLYTGTAGFVDSRATVARLPIILLGNIAGCLLMALAMKYCDEGISEKALAIVERRLDYDIPAALMLSACCGFIMTVAVKFARAGSYLPLLFGVPLFILCGFIHSIADAFYTLVSPASYLIDHWGELLVFYAVIVVGNFVGCNLYRIVMWRPRYD